MGEPDERGGQVYGGHVYFEFTAIGRSVKVSAIDAASGLEVSVTGPASASQADLRHLALRKLRARQRAAQGER